MNFESFDLFLTAFSMMFDVVCYTKVRHVEHGEFAEEARFSTPNVA
jgi:hypothetical protein